MPTTSNANQAADTLKAHASSQQLQDNDSTVYVRFQPDSTAATINGVLKKNRPVNILVDVKTGKQLTAFFSAKTPGLNVRINQLFTPDENSDGPFGEQLKLAIKQHGMYRIVVGSNLMAEGLTAGTFRLRVTVE